MSKREFEEIAHSGGKVTLSVVATESDEKFVQFTHSNSRPVPAVLIGVYAYPPDIVIEPYNFAGYGGSSRPPTIPGSIPVLIGSDSEGKFGHNCPKCDEYWRSGPFPNYCPYCSLSTQSHQFLSTAQRKYIELYCEKWQQVQLGDVGTETTIDLDKIADATINGTEKPAFYIADERQQTLLRCRECNEFNDILGKFGHCSLCFTRNDFEVLSQELFPAIRKDLNAGLAPDRCLRDTVSAFDTCIKQYSRVLALQVPMTPRRRDFMQKSNFSSLSGMAEKFTGWFDINLRKNISEEEWEAANRLVLRRHVYEHNGGVVDENYVSRSKDKTVRLGQRISEKSEDIHQLISSLLLSAKKVHDGFHEILPPDRDVIAYRQKRSKQR